MERGRGGNININYDFLVSISVQPNVVDFRYFKLWMLLDKIIKVWNIKGLHYQGPNVVNLTYDAELLTADSKLKVKKGFELMIHNILFYVVSWIESKSAIYCRLQCIVKYAYHCIILYFRMRWFKFSKSLNENLRISWNPSDSRRYEETNQSRK